MEILRIEQLAKANGQINDAHAMALIGEIRRLQEVLATLASENVSMRAKLARLEKMENA